MGKRESSKSGKKMNTGKRESRKMNGIMEEKDREAEEEEARGEDEVVES